MSESHHDRLYICVANLDCDSEAAAIRRAMTPLSGVLDVEVRPSSASVTILFDPASVTADRLRHALREAGYPPVDPASTRRVAPWRNRKVQASLASGFLLAAGWVLGASGIGPTAPLTLYLASMVVGGYFFAREAVLDLVREREIGIELLMTSAALAASCLGAPEEGAILVFLYSISEAAEGYTAEKTRSAIRALMKLAPPTATVLRDGTEVEVRAQELVPGDVFLVRPGESVATDGTILSGRSAIDEAPVTGESIPVEKGPGDGVLAGTINRAGALEVRASKAFAENTLSRIIALVEEAQERKGKSQRFIERFGRWYSPWFCSAAHWRRSSRRQSAPPHGPPRSTSRRSFWSQQRPVLWSSRSPLPSSLRSAWAPAGVSS